MDILGSWDMASIFFSLTKIQDQRIIFIIAIWLMAIAPNLMGAQL
jgi:hypothetical protein